MTQPQDMQQLISQAAEMQANLQKAQEEILATSLTGTAANGLVEVTMTGGAEVTDIKIDPQVVDADDVETLQDLILGAFQDGHRKAGELAKEKMGPLSQGMGDGDINNLMGGM
ncbi:YbaB/EbfC family nucleoid-associated protein [Corynebacterium sp. MNWGS58]|uniref:YbaB/EbfC family nucleoid-associated protein n=1 Tax=Corynebacterium sp. 102791.4 TaxID=3104612 RepID=UPI003512747F